jgi:uncharacterized protein (DUF1810 family)
MPDALERFTTAQADVIDGATAELRAGHKSGHWMWFIFPQLLGLGRSEMSRFYAIASLEEARAYLAHPVLGPRLRECTSLLLDHDDRSAEAILGPIDATKLRSCMTLFAAADPNAPLFDRALSRFFDGERDPLTIDLLGGA